MPRFVLCRCVLRLPPFLPPASVLLLPSFLLHASVLLLPSFLLLDLSPRLSYQKNYISQSNIKQEIIDDIFIFLAGLKQILVEIEEINFFNEVCKKNKFCVFKTVGVFFRTTTVFFNTTGVFFIAIIDINL